MCRETVAVPKEYNLRRHLETKHPIIAKLDQNEKSLKTASLMKSLGKEQQFSEYSTTKVQKLQM